VRNGHMLVNTAHDIWHSGIYTQKMMCLKKSLELTFDLKL